MIIVEDENGEITKEFMPDVDAQQLYHSMRCAIACPEAQLSAPANRFPLSAFPLWYPSRISFTKNAARCESASPINVLSSGGLGRVGTDLWKSSPTPWGGSEMLVPRHKFG